VGGALRAGGRGRRAGCCRLNAHGCAHGAESGRIEHPCPPGLAQRAAKSQIIRPQRQERGDVVGPQGAGETTQQSRSPRARDELGEPRGIEVMAEATALLPGRIEHDAGKAEIARALDHREIGLLIRE
jgi:hypothetical protein